MGFFDNLKSNIRSKTYVFNLQVRNEYLYDAIETLENKKDLTHEDENDLNKYKTVCGFFQGEIKTPHNYSICSEPLDEVFNFLELHTKSKK